MTSTWQVSADIDTVSPGRPMTRLMRSLEEMPSMGSRTTTSQRVVQASSLFTSTPVPTVQGALHRLADHLELLDHEGAHEEGRQGGDDDDHPIRWRVALLLGGSRRRRRGDRR